MDMQPFITIDNIVSLALLGIVCAILVGLKIADIIEDMERKDASN